MRLILMRHASALAASSDGDIGRPLSEKGVTEATMLGAWLSEQADGPDLVLCSTARRAQETWGAVRAVLASPPDERSDGELYLASSAELRQVVSEIEASWSCVLLIAHNPGISRMALDLTTGVDEAGHARLKSGFSPASTAIVDVLAPTWTRLSEGGARLVEFASPRSLG